MNKNRVTLLEVYERNVKAGTCQFKSWCELVEWVSKSKATVAELNVLGELSESAFDVRKQEKHEPKKSEKAGATKAKPPHSEPDKEG